MKKYNLVCSKTFVSKKGVTFLRIDFCDNDGVYSFLTDQVDGFASVLLGLAYLSEFKANVFFYYGRDGQRRCIITACEVK